MITNCSYPSSYARFDADVRLMLQVREGDDQAFDELVRRYDRRVHRTLIRLQGDSQYAEDLAQEVFLRVYRSRNSYAPTSRFWTWLFVIIKNVSLNAHRSPARRYTARMTDISAADDLVPASDQQPLAQLERAELQRAVRHAIGKLCERQRTAVSLQTFQQMAYDEIAQQMRISPQAVKSLLARARASLRDHLRPYVATDTL